MMKTILLAFKSHGRVTSITSKYSLRSRLSMGGSIALGTGILYGVHTYMIQNQSGQVNMMNKIMLIAATDGSTIKGE